MSLCIAALLFALHCLLTLCGVDCCRRVPGGLVQVDVGIGLVFGVNRNGEIYRLNGPTWTLLPGNLKHVTVGSAGVWGVNTHNKIYKLVADKWEEVPGTLKQIDAGGPQFVAGASTEDNVYCLKMGYTVDYKRPGSAVDWVRIPGSLKYYSCGPYSCWGVNTADQIWMRRVTSASECQGTGDWINIPGSLAMVEVAGDGSVYGVNQNGQVLRRDDISPGNPKGKTWTEITFYSGQVKHVSYDLGHLWLILKNDEIYDCTI